MLLVLAVLPLFNTITGNINATTVTTITTMPKGMKLKLSRDLKGEGELNHNAPSVCRLSKGCNNYILGTVWYVNLKLAGLVVRDVELTKRKYLYPNATASTHSTIILLLVLLRLRVLR